MDQPQPPPFDARSVIGKDPQKLDLQLPAVIQDLYQVAERRQASQEPLPHDLPDGWSRISNDELTANGIDVDDLHNRKSGFDAGFYRGPEGQVVLTFCGTDQARDWASNLGQGVGLPTKQYEDAMELARKAKSAFGPELVLSGHSLGGGLASAAAVVTNTPAVTYNSAGVNSFTFIREKMDPAAARAVAANGLVRSYNVENELLTHLQEGSLATRWLMPDAIGHRIELPDPDPLSFGKRMIPGAMLLHRLDLHGIDSVMKSMSMQQLRDAEQGKAVDGPTPTVSGRLFEDAVIGLEPQRQRLGLGDDAQFLNAAAGLAANSGAQGMRHIDHVVASGERVFAVQGGLNDPAHQRGQLNLANENAANLPDHMARLDEQQQQRDQAAQQAPEQRHRQMGMA